MAGWLCILRYSRTPKYSKSNPATSPAWVMQTSLANLYQLRHTILRVRRSFARNSRRHQRGRMRSEQRHRAWLVGVQSRRSQTHTYASAFRRHSQKGLPVPLIPHPTLVSQAPYRYLKLRVAGKVQRFLGRQCQTATATTRHTRKREKNLEREK